MSRRRVVFVTCENSPQVSSDDLAIVSALDRMRVDVQAVPWTSNETDWSAYDGIVVRSCWDYHLKPRHFVSWLNNIRNLQVPVFNAPDLMCWNMHKSYFNTLKQNGIAIAPYRIIHSGCEVNLEEIFRETGWQRAVIKPCISANSHETSISTHESANSDSARLQPLAASRDFIIQEFVNEVCSYGEMSLMFFDRQYSHSVMKTVAPGDFRIQKAFGGRAAQYDASSSEIDFASRVLDTVDGDLLYARVDVVRSQDDLLLMEVELIEPVLFFEHDEDAAELFAQSLLRILAR